MVDIDVPIWAARLQLLRRGRTWSRAELAALLRAEAGSEELPGQEELVRRIRLWEAGQERPGEPYTELLCRVFGTDERGLLVGDAAGTTLWHYLTGIPLAPGLFTAEEEERTGRAIEAPERGDAGTVSYFRTLLDSCTRADLRPAGQLSLLRPVFGGITGFQRDAASPVRRALLLLAGENAELISRVHHENGDQGGALTWSDEAIRDAREAADTLLEAYALAQRGGLSEPESDPSGLVDLAVAARAHGHLPPRMDALARHHEALGHALAGDLDMCHRRLEESAESLAEPGEGRPYSFDCSAESHNALCVACLVTLGQARGALELLEGEQGQATPTYAAAYALACVAHAYAAAHEREPSVEAARRARELARRTGARRALRELASFTIPEPRSSRTVILLATT